MSRAQRDPREQFAELADRIARLAPQRQQGALDEIADAVTRAERGLPSHVFSSEGRAAAVEIDGFNEPTRIRLMEAVQRIAECHGADPATRRPARKRARRARQLGANVIDFQARRAR